MISARATTIYFGFRELQILQLMKHSGPYCVADTVLALGIKTSVASQAIARLIQKGYVKPAGFRTSEANRMIRLYMNTRKGDTKGGQFEHRLKPLFPEHFALEGTNVAGKILVDLQRGQTELIGKRKSTWREVPAPVDFGLPEMQPPGQNLLAG